MFYQKDYVLRMIEMLGDLLRRIKAIVVDRVAAAELDQVSRRACGLPLDALRTWDAGLLADTLEEPQRYLAAELLLIDIEVQRRTQTDDALLPTYVQALALFASLREADYMLPAAGKSAAIVRAHLASLPAGTLLGSAALFEAAGQYADGEDALFAAIAIDPAHAGAAEAFIARLYALDETALRAGGLSHAELDEASSALNR